MGRDIHLYAEKLQDDGTWALLPAPITGIQSVSHCGRKPDEYRLAIDPAKYLDGYRLIGDGRILRGWYTARNHAVFAMLAGYSDGIISVADPRGLPSDVCPAISEESRIQCGHSHSHMQLDELRLYFRCYPEYRSKAPCLLALLDELDGYGLPDEIRIVFFFDN